MDELTMIQGEGSTWEVGSEESAKIWGERWAKKLAVMPHVDWENFRADEKFMDGLQERDDFFDIQFGWCLSEKVPANLMTDSGIGNPPGRVLGGRNFCTATSMRHARYIHSIRQNCAWKITYRAAQNLHVSGIRVVEIGSGFGGLAAKFVENFPVASYMLVDAEPMLDIARHFLSERFGKERVAETFTFYHGYPKDHECDFVIATNCIGEMDDKSIRKYFDFIQTNLVPGGVFYSNNIESSFYDYPWDEHWDFLLTRYWGHTVVETIAELSV
jgi:SAM-dependent methyltransferase